ncbi:Lipase (class 3) [compost metagenome]|uniref:lipase family protein n=1 Tax=Janthinobacterium sp. AD80 TaxID=1528773 RepID=UPI000CAFCEAE|nr:hypothetical protein [Janthinobacterium sp. AD80]PMQ16808.1 hypothetical protein JaAD80_09055 [Janthinobacterium sp. AD80]
MQAKRHRLILALFFLPWLAGCGAMSSWRASQRISYTPMLEKVLVTPAPTLDDAASYVPRFALMALFSQVVYRHDMPEARRVQDGCGYLAGGDDVFGMPADAQGRRWRRLVWTPEQLRAQPSLPPPCYQQHGLYYETYVHRGAGADGDDVAVIAIRGTENWALRVQAADWSANAAASFGIDAAQYRAARETIHPLAVRMKEDNPRLRVFVTGHSLGGGIAQQIAYMGTEVDAAYVFDSSPVTNWSEMMLMQPSPVKNAYPQVFRIYHRNEILQDLRNLSTRMMSKQLERADYEFYFHDSKKIASHDMAILTCNFAGFIKDDTAPFDYPASFAAQVLRDPVLCAPVAPGRP